MLLTDRKAVFERVKQLMNENPDTTPEGPLAELGFVLVGVGGGYKAFRLDFPDGSHISVADNEGDGKPATLGESILQIYSATGDILREFELAKAMPKPRGP